MTSSQKVFLPFSHETLNRPPSANNTITNTNFIISIKTNITTFIPKNQLDYISCQ